MHLQDRWIKPLYVGVFETLTREALSEVLLSARDGLGYAQVFFQYRSSRSRVYKKDYRDFRYEIFRRKKKVRAESDRADALEDNLNDVIRNRKIMVELRQVLPETWSKN